MNIFRQELRMMRTGAIVWGIVLCGLALMYIGLYPAFSSDATQTRELFSHIPAAVKSAFNIDVDTLLSFLGFFAFTFTNLSLAAGIYAVHTGVSVLSREQRSKTTDFLLTKPQSRAKIYLQKFFAGFSLIVAVWAVFAVISFLLAKLFGAADFNVTRFMLLMIALLIVELWLYVFGLFLTQVMKRLKATIPITLAATFGLFMIGMVGAIINEPKLYYFSPFKFFDYVNIASGKGYELKYMIVAVVTMLAAGIASYLIYVKRDQKAAV